MARATVRPALAAMLSSLTDTAGDPLFRGVFPVEPPRIDAKLFPACVVMVPESQNERTGMRQKHDLFGCQLRLVHALAITGWAATGTGEGGNVFTPPDTDPQVVFDMILDQLVDGLMANQAFTQDAPGGNRSIVELGQKISVRVTEPEKQQQRVLLGALVEFTVREQIIGV